ncbi:hypothetical protein ACQP1O_37880 [Nocardia sp. CA-151230]|uniref:hypothetical protein n=1 Tax=Nocardia sp. CA-151230 TaxID=3239982 RepID=UPI003D92CDFF
MATSRRDSLRCTTTDLILGRLTVGTRPPTPEYRIDKTPTPAMVQTDAGKQQP